MTLSNKSMVKKNNGKEEDKSGRKKQGTLINSIILSPTIFILFIFWLNTRCQNQKCMPTSHYLYYYYFFGLILHPLSLLLLLFWLNTTCQNQKCMPTSHYLYYYYFFWLNTTCQNFQKAKQ